MAARLISVTMAVFFTAVCVRAADRTWNGGGSDAKWSTPANWGGTAPTTNDTLYFGGSAKLANTNDLPEDTAFAGIFFNSGAGAFALSGNRLTLVGGVTNVSANVQTLNVALALTNTCIVTASNAAITVNGAISGAGGLLKAGTQMLTLTASNSYDGATLVTNGVLSITHANALGSTNGNTVVKGILYSGNGNLQLSGGIVVEEPLTLSGERSGNSSSMYNLSGSNTWSGPITRQGQIRIHGAGSSTLVIAGGLTGSGGLLVLNTVGTIAFNAKPVNIGTDTVYMETSGGTIAVGVAGNTWGPTRIINNNCTMRMDITNALPATSSLQFGYNSAGARTCILNLNGFDQTVGELSNFIISLGVHQITTPTPATLTVNQSTTTLFAGQLSGAASLTKIGAGTLTLSNSLSAATGNITVTNGTLVVAAANSLGNSTNVTVAGGTLELRTSAGIADTASLSIANSGKVKIATNLVETVNALFLGGVQQVSGTWGPSGSGAAHINDTYLTGGGKIYVLSTPPISPVSATWDAGGADTLMSTTNNWEGDVLPTFSNTTYAIFGTVGSTATVDTAISLYGMTFNRAGSFTLANGNGAITLGAGGITAAIPDTTPRAYALAEELNLLENSTWDVSTNGTGLTTLTVSGRVANGIDPYGFTKAGGGTLVLPGSNSYNGVTSVNNGLLSVTHANALGSTNGNTVINGPAGGCVQFSGNIDVSEPLVLNGERVNPLNTGGLWSLKSLSGSNTLRGPITRTGLQTRVQVESGSTLVFKGGVTGGNSQFVTTLMSSTACMAFYEKPVNVGAQALYIEGTGLTIIGIAGNTWGQTCVVGAGSTLRLSVANALPASTSLKLGYDAIRNITVDLNGYDQTVGELLHYVTPTTGNQGITSQTPATLTVNQSSSTLFAGPLTGALSLTKTGTGTLTLSNSLSSTTGNITVTNGTLVAACANSLGNSTNITVTGAAAQLELRTSSGITNTAALTIANDGAKVNLAAGVNEAVGYLYFGNKQQRAGAYSATSGSGVQVVDPAHFAGTGILTVLHDKSGSLLRVW